MSNTWTGTLFVAVLALTTFAVVTIWPSYPQRYLPGDFWPEGRGIDVFGFERETMRLGLDLKGGSYLLLEADTEGFTGDVGEALDTNKEVMERRVNAFGVAESEIQRVSGNRLAVQIPGLPIEEAEDLIGATAQLEFMEIGPSGALIPATGVVNGQEIAMSGEFLQNNTFPERFGITNAVVFNTTGEGNELMRQITTRLVDAPVGRDLLIIRLDGVEISRATVQGVISDTGTISGLDSFTEARNLSRQLNAGALPLPLRIIQANEVSATLGDQSVVDTVKAGQIGLIAVALFMILYYRLPGVLATAALIVYTSLTLMVFKLWPVTLTLSGIAAFVLSVGMAVDANILIFERMKEELRRGRTLNAAIDRGFSRAWPSIRDSNISTLITCLILFWFGDQFAAAPVKGFALTLAIGVLISMFSAITVTRTFLKMVVGTPVARNAWLFNAGERDRPLAGTRRQPVEGGGGD